MSKIINGIQAPAYYRWLAYKSKVDNIPINELILERKDKDRNMVEALLKRTGDSIITENTFIKAAEIVTNETSTKVKN